MSIFHQTGWSFVTAGGVEVDVGISKFLFLAGEAGAFYAKKDSGGPIWRLPYTAAGAGLGPSVSAGGALTLQVSLPFQPGGGFEIYRNPLRSSAFGAGSFVGSFVMISGAAAVGFSSSVSYLIFGAPSRLVNTVRMMGPLGLAAGINATVLACQGAGALWGTAETSAAGAGVTVYTGEILSMKPAAPGETG
jgi:hypothetical protein